MKNLLLEARKMEHKLHSGEIFDIKFATITWKAAKIPDDPMAFGRDERNRISVVLPGYYG